MDDNSRHEKYMNRCLSLAAKGAGYVAPNPMVGCVIVHQGRIIGEGWHEECGKAHAEVNAINSVGEQELLKESTLYVNLEPCSHFGKTPPCSQLIIDKGIPDIVIGTEDMNPLVAGKGINELRDAGRNVISGMLQDECYLLNRRFFTFHKKKRPYVILKWAQTRDGFIDIKRDTTARAEINWITDESARTLVHKWRSEEAAILVGSETVLKDNPQLTLRNWPGRQPLRIIVDRRDRITPGHNALDRSANTLIMSRKSKTENNLEWVEMPQHGSLVPIMLKILYDREIQSVIIEGGAFTINQFLQDGMWDEARVFTGNKEFGEGVEAPGLDADPVQEIDVSGDRLQVYFNLELPAH